MDSNRLAKLTTEGLNPHSAEIDRWHALEIVRLINREDRGVLEAVAACENEIARVVELVENAFRTGGRLIYMGAGTSGRLGVLDASECPPTFSTPPEMVVGLIAGGDTALRRAIEGAEDSPEQGAQALVDIQLSHRDVVVGIATSGRTPYVIGGMNHARSVGASVVALVCNQGSEMADLADVVICAVVGPEVVSGSTRLKAGTATKLILNSITTAAMVRIGKTFGNLMVDLRATNTKLIARSRRLVRLLTGVDEATADHLLTQADGKVKIAIVMHHRQTDAAMAAELLKLEGGHLRKVIGDVAVHELTTP